MRERKMIWPITSDHNSGEGKGTNDKWRRPDFSRGQRDDHTAGRASEGRDCFRELSNPGNLENLKEYARVLARYEEICQSYDPIRTEPLIKQKLAYYFRGEYHLKGGEWILAEKVYRKALKVWAPKETSDIIPDERIKLRLLMIYHAQENFIQADPILKELLALVGSGRAGHCLSDDDICCIYTILCEIHETDLRYEDLEALKNMLAQIHRDIQECPSHKLLKLSDKCLVFVFVSIILLSGNPHVSGEDCAKYREILDYVHENKDALLAGDHQQSLLLDAYEEILKEISS